MEIALHSGLVLGALATGTFIAGIICTGYAIINGEFSEEVEEG